MMIRKGIRMGLVAMLAIMLAGCGESLPEEDVKDGGIKPVYKQAPEETMPSAIKTDSSVAGNSEKPKSVEPKTAQKAEPARRKAADSPVPAQSQSAVAETATSVINYGTGHTHLSIKKKQEEKLKRIQGDYDKKLQDAAKE